MGIKFRVLNLVAIIVLILSIFSGVTLTGCTGGGGGGGNATEWDIPIMSITSGAFAGAWADAWWAIQAMSDYVNDNLGGIAGKPVKFTLAPIGTDVASAVSAAGSVIDSRPLIAFLWTTPDQLTAVAPAFYGANLTILGLTYTKTLYLVYGSREVSYNVADFGQYVGTEALWLNDNNVTNNVTINNVALVVDTGVGSSPTWGAQANAMAAAINATGRNATVISFSSTGVVDWTPVVSPWLAAGYDGFLPWATPLPMVGLFNKIYQLGFNQSSRFMIPFFASTAAFFSLATNNATGIYYHMTNVDPTYSGALWQSMWAGDQAFLGGAAPNPSMLAASCNAVLMLKKAIENSGITGNTANVTAERPMLLSAWRNLTQVDGIVGPINMYNGFIQMNNYVFEAAGNNTMLTSRLVGTLNYSANSVYTYYNS